MPDQRPGENPDTERGPTMMRVCSFILMLGCLPALAGPLETLPGTRPLTEQGDLSKAMLDGIWTKFILLILIRKPS